jgi:hypothetical protein
VGRSPTLVGVEPDQLEREVKFVLLAGRGPLARSLVATVCRPDPVYPAATVSTIYFDTPDLQLLGEKINSDYLKTKVRLRWYSPIGSRDDSGRSFLEIKSRVGDRREKRRLETPLTAGELRGMPFDSLKIREVLDLARPLGVAIPARLLPVLLIQYERYRFVEQISGSRVSIDMNIRAPRGYHLIVRDAAPVVLRHVVLEIKGAATDLPRALHPLALLGARRASFSKFAAAGFAMLKYAA